MKKKKRNTQLDWTTVANENNVQKHASCSTRFFPAALQFV